MTRASLLRGAVAGVLGAAVTPTGGVSSPQPSSSLSFMQAEALSLGAAPGNVAAAVAEVSSQSVSSSTNPAG